MGQQKLRLAAWRSRRRKTPKTRLQASGLVQKASPWTERGALGSAARGRGAVGDARAEAGCAGARPGCRACWAMRGGGRRSVAVMPDGESA
eukprot:6197523-Pleurochrysis_carterae.AAC.3